MFRILYNTSWDFVGRWKLAMITVALFVVPATIMVPLRGFDYSVEFTGGVEMRLRFEQAPALADVRSALNEADVLNAEVTTFGSNEEIRIRAQDRTTVDAQASGAESISIEIERVLHAKFGASAFERLSADAIGPRVGAELRRNAIIATLIAFVLSLIYLAWRFEWRFGVAAVVATLHDSLATLAFLMYMDIEISLFVVGSILTVVGYSMNDTVVVFDRVRENLRRNRKSDFGELINRSINETLPRTVMTSATTVAALLALLFFGGAVMRPFSLVLTFGIVVGTFSSMWVGAPLLIWLEEKWPRSTDATPHARPNAASKA